MTTDQQLASALRGYYAEESVERADRERMTQAVLRKTGRTPQGRHRLWPFSVDSVVIRGPWLPRRASAPASKEGAPAMGLKVTSALKFVAGAAIVALFGGFLLASVLSKGQPDEAMRAAASGGATEMPTACPPGSTPDQPGPADQPRPLDGKWYVPAVGVAAFDRHAGKIVYLIKASENLETWLLDVCTNTWSLARRDEAHEMSPLSAVYDPGARRTLVVDYSGTWGYDSSTNRWTRHAAVAPEPFLPRLAYDASSGRAIVGSMEVPYPVWTYDAESYVWQPALPETPGQVGEGAVNRMLTYDSSVERLLAYDGGSVELLDEESGTWEPTEARSPVTVSGGWLSWGGEIAHDEAAGRTVLVGNDAVIAYDAFADEWETLSLAPDELTIGMHHTAIYDPINERIVIIGGEFYDPEVSEASLVRRDDVWAFDSRTGEWTELVPSLPGQPPA